MESSLKHMAAEQIALKATIPAQWTERHKTFANLLKKETNARRLYRRNVDGAYEPVQKVVETIAAAGELAGLKSAIDGLRDVINTQEPKMAAKHIAKLLPKVGAVAGARKIRSKLSNVRRALKSRTPDKAKALKRLDIAMKLYETELTWRQNAAQTVLAGLQTYEEAIRNTVGLRKQPRLPENVAIDVASCLANHRDISLHF
jgi:hypothetical protein